MSREAHFSLGGSVKKIIQELGKLTIRKPLPLHSQRVTVQCAITAQEVIETNFF